MFGIDARATCITRLNCRSQLLQFQSLRLLLIFMRGKIRMQHLIDVVEMPGDELLFNVKITGPPTLAAKPLPAVVDPRRLTC